MPYFAPQPLNDTVAHQTAYTIQPSESGREFTNAGAGDLVPYTLPPYQDGLECWFAIENDSGISITSPDTQIRIVAVLSSSVRSTTIGAYVRLRARNGIWRSRGTGGTWK